MSISEKIGRKSLGYWLIAASSAVAVISTVLYLIFGISSHTFTAGIFLCLLFATLLGASLTFYDKFFGDYIVIASVILFTFGLGLFVSDSVFDFADAITQIPLYGNMDNAPFRVVIIIFSVVGILLAVAGSFFRRVKDDRL